MPTELERLNVLVATWLYHRDHIEVHQGGKYIYYRTTWNERDNEWNIEPLPDLTKSESIAYHLKETFPILTTRCFDPSISYDNEMGQWSITLHNWTSGCSRDSPVEYCHEAEEIPLTLCRCIEQIVEEGGNRCQTGMK